MKDQITPSLSVAVIGASGKTGRLIAARLLKAGHIVRAISRTPPNLINHGDDRRMTFIAGDVCKDDPRDWVQGTDIVIFTAAGTEKDSYAVDKVGAEKCAKAASQLGVQSFVLVSAHGAHNPFSWGAKFTDYLEAKSKGEIAVRSHFPEATVLRPGILTDDPARGCATIRASTGPGEDAISRDDVASVVVSCALRADARGATIEVVGGETELNAALDQCLQPIVA